MEFSAEELAFFANIFSAPAVSSNSEHDSEHKLTVQAQVPASIYQVLEQAKLTLLAEVSHYQLWFPFELQVEGGEFKPILGIPEVVDLNGGERSWRVQQLDKDVQLMDDKGKPHHLLSLSNTGFAFKVSDKRSIKRILNERKMNIMLPNENQISVEFEPVRTDSDVIAARISNIQKGRENLRKFLFNLHKKENHNLYEGLN